jgi:phosphatidylglycerophosphate synthase
LVLVVAAAAIQLRLLANLLDGMVAVEGGRRTPTGDLFNEVPDRIADLLILVAAGYGVTWISWGDTLGWAAGAGALLTAYVRQLGGALGVSQHFVGPMAKPHRMALLTAACVASIGEVASGGYAGRVMTAALGLVLLGSLVTAVRRLRLVAEELRAR